MAIIPEARRAH